MPDPVKHEDKAWVKAEQERRRSSVAQPHRNRRKYYRPTQKADMQKGPHPEG